MLFLKIGIQKKGNKYIFSYSSNDEQLYWYDVDENKLHRSTIDALVRESSGPLELPRSFILSDPSLPAALGGVTFGFGAKDILKDPKKIAGSIKNQRSREKILAGALGMISGYRAGYWAATRGTLPELDDPKIINIVKQEDRWIAWEIRVLINIYSSMRAMTDHIENADKKKIYEGLLLLTSAKAVKRSEEGDLISSDLDSLAKLDEIIRKKYEEELNKEELVDKIFFFYLPWGLFSIGILFIAYFLISEYLESRKRA